MKDILFIFGVLLVWFGLSRWVLPLFGIHTCMSGQCPITSNARWDADASQPDAPTSRPSDDVPNLPTNEK